MSRARPLALPTMSRFVEIAVLALGGLSLFAVAFLGFASMAGTPMEDVPLIGPLFEEADADPAPAQPAASGSADTAPPSREQTIRANVGLLSAFSVEAAFDAGELEDLSRELKTARLELDQRLEAVAAREAEVERRAEHVDRQFATLEELRAELEEFEARLRLREQEVLRDEAAFDETEAAALAEVARLFASGDAEELASRLVRFPPEEAARLLRSLDAERAAELLNALPDDRWKEYVDAYSAP